MLLRYALDTSHTYTLRARNKGKEPYDEMGGLVTRKEVSFSVWLCIWLCAGKNV